MNDSEAKSARPTAIYVDAVQAHAQLFSCQLVFGTHDLEGGVESRVHLTMSPTFALQLARVLQDVIEPYTTAVGADDEAARADADE